MKRFCIFLQRFDIFFPLTGGCPEGLGAFYYKFILNVGEVRYIYNNNNNSIVVGVDTLR